MPLSILTDHSFGVQSVAFSADSRWLCSLGNSYDGFLLLYSVNLKTGKLRLHSSNKCSNVQTIVWMGANVISIGTRHVKLWRVERAGSAAPAKGRHDLLETPTAPPESPGPQIFSGRNCILGPLIDATFTCAVAVSENKAILCTTQGDICLMDDSEKAQRLVRVASVQFGVQSITFDEKTGLAWVAGEEARIEAIAIDTLFEPFDSSTSPSSSSKRSSPIRSSLRTQPGILAIGSIGSHLVTIDSDRIVEVRRKDEKHFSNALTDSRRLPAHESAVIGICNLVYRPHIGSPDFLTYSARGTLLLWCIDGTCTGRIDLSIDQPLATQGVDPNELKRVVVSDFDELVFAGDRTGMLRVIDRGGKHITQAQAHNGDISGLAVARSNDCYLVASCGRDRTLQLFSKDESGLSLLQTLDDHAAAVGNLMFVDNAATLLSMSSDRTIIIRRAARDEVSGMAFIPIRIINLKATPVSLSTVPSEPNLLVVSTMDRQIQRYEISSGRLLHSFKASDPVSNDTVQINSLEVHSFGDTNNAKRLLLGVSSTDRSIRLHDFESGSLLTKEHGQSAVSAVKLMQRKEDDKVTKYLISSGLDGTIIIYTVSWALPRETNGLGSPSRAESPLKQTPNSTQPLRRILSKAELSEFQKSLESSDGDAITPMRSPSPSRVRRKTSRFSLANPPRMGSGSHMIMTDSSARKALQDQSSTSTSPKALRTPRSNRLSLDHRHRSRSAANLNDLNDSAEQMCKALRAFRKRIASSVADKLKPDTARELELELDLALGAMRENRNTGGNHMASGAISGDLHDTYLAKMIDERLALKTGSGEEFGVQEAQAAGTTPNEQASAGASVKQTADMEKKFRT